MCMIKDYNVELLNIEDVRRRRSRNPEPKEVSEIRENILNSFSKLRFEDVGHKYFLDREDGSVLELQSVSHTIHQYIPHVDWEVIKANKARKLGMTVEDLTKVWKIDNLKGTTNGTVVHQYGEAFFRMLLEDEDEVNKLCYHQYEEGYLIPYGAKQEAIAKYMWDMSKIDGIYPILPETRVYMGISDSLTVKHPFAGTFDMLYCIKQNGKFKLMIHDYKTNKSLVNDYNRDKGNCLSYPFSNMINESMSIYTLQLACYSLALMQLGYEIVDRRLIWLKDDGTYERYSLPDMTKEMHKALNL